MASVHATAPDPTSVYRYYDRAGMLIYVGITRQGMGRNVQHNNKADWWGHVSSQEVEHYPNRRQAAEREKALIRHYRPPFNKQHNVEHESLRTAYLATAAVPWKHSTPIELYKRLGKMLPLEVESFVGSELTFRTRREHTPLSMLLQAKKGGVPLCGQRGLGMLKAIGQNGTHTYLVCSARPTCPRDIDGGIAYLAMQQQVKPMYVRLDRIAIVQWVSR